MRKAMISGERNRRERSRSGQERQLTAWLMCLVSLWISDRPALAQESAVLAELNAQTTPEKAIAFTWKTVLKECERTDGPSPSIFYLSSTANDLRSPWAQHDPSTANGVQRSFHLHWTCPHF